ncbi:MAG: DNA repair protein RecN [Flavobacteriaceae bacterium]|nr:DNA repair protein RecN [Flavobacteriaceae bacterium]MBT3754335.1 DNA repair protein RecN [Flavobacteriaceae bacterium]MBT3794670.1 DNA repair protein RecN [Flavobacteriaceae bacterium]MBT4063503.1 DNA repair protein RecN [Flavobacteriaceae bacterium]MBT4246790.1 DNA repair protein RecN [Flavobacteriaceae bacterium]
MLTKISIKNFALIDKIEIDFSNGFSTITGDTGSGKSILLNALSLLTGKRADHNSLKDNNIKCIIEAEFCLSKLNIKYVFDENNLDYFDQTILRREILPSGKSRSFVNDTPANLEIMKSIGEKLIDIHTQHESLMLSNDYFFFSLIDNLSEQQNIVKNFSENLLFYNEQSLELEKLNRLNISLKNDYDYNLYILNELLNSKLVLGEQEEIESKLKMLKNSEEIRTSLEQIDSLLYLDESSIENKIIVLNSIISNISKYSDNYLEIKDRIESILIELDDIKTELNIPTLDFSNDSSELERMELRINIIYNLQKKHSVNSVAELIKKTNKLQLQLQKNENIEIDIENLQNEIVLKESLLDEQSKKISISRKKILPKLKLDIESILNHLGMENASFNFNINDAKDYNKFGKDTIEVMFSSNKGIEYAPLFKVASGGELSRILLSIKSILSSHSKLPTMIFDEIDTGISGEMSNAMANIMLGMSKNMQIIAITHLPQIAAKGDHHFNVYKHDNFGITNTKIKKLNFNERVDEIAKMLSGDILSDSALVHARELLN